MKIGALIAFVLILLASGASIASFSSYWFKLSVKDSNEGFEVNTYYNYNKVLAEVGDISQTAGYDDIPGSYKQQLKFYKCAIAFAILAFVNLFFASIGLGIAAFKGITPQHATKLKNSLNSAVVFLIIACLVFLGITKARRDDCESNQGDIGSDSMAYDQCDTDLYHKFSGKIEMEGTSISWGPTTSWIAVTISMGITFFTTIFVYIGGVLNSEDTN